jgi:phosphoribosylformylglycinamidine synthase PurS subunit
VTTAAATTRATMAGVQLSVLVEVRLRPGIADPQGATIERSLPTLGFDNVHGVTVGKAIRCTVEADDAEAARQQVEELCRRFLTNPVIEDATITVEPVAVAS